MRFPPLLFALASLLLTETAALAQVPVPRVPLAREGHAMAHDPSTGGFVLLGGRHHGASGLSDTWLCDASGWRQVFPSTTPPPRWNNAMATDTARGRVVMFGGGGGPGYLGDTFEWNGTDWVLRTLSGPSPRVGHAMAYDSVRGRVVLFGGSNNSGRLGDTWTWDGTTWNQETPVNSPDSRSDHSMAFDPANSRVVLFGGYGSAGLIDDTWSWNGVDWVQSTPSIGVPIESNSSMVFDALHQQMLLFSVSASIPRVAKTLRLVGNSWQQQGGAQPMFRFHQAMAYSPLLGVVMHGGWTLLPSTFWLADTWRWNGSTWNFQAGTNSAAVHLYGSGCGPSSLSINSLSPNGVTTTMPRCGEALVATLRNAPIGAWAMCVWGLEPAAIPFGLGCQLLV
jgi:hypothetical protein